MSEVAGSLLDTNACLYLLKHQVDPSFAIENGQISVITEIELLGYPDLTSEDESLIRSFLSRFPLIPVDEAVRGAAIQLRRKYRLRLGDALICGTALSRQVSLISHDKELSKISELQVVTMPLIA